MSKLMVSVSGIRGIVGDTLTPEIMLRFASAFAQYCQHGTIVIGRDSRVTGELMTCCINTALLSSGCRVIDLGIVSTPSVQLMVKELCADGGIAITASHNGIEWNAMKFITSRGLFLTRDEFKKFMPIYKKNRFRRVRWDLVRTIEQNATANRVYLDKLMNLPFIDREKIRQKRFRVALDCVNGAGGVICPHLLRELGCEVVEINCVPNGIFSHNPEPVPENLKQLCKAVKETDADIGFAVDPDVDRLAVVSDKGKAVGEEYTLALAGAYLLARRKGDVVVNLSTSRMIEDIAAQNGCRVIRTPVGEINVSTELVRRMAVFGGEGNGGVMLPEIHPCRDAVVGMEIILQYMAASGKSVSQLIRGIPRYVIEKKKVNTGNINMREALIKLKKAFPNGRVDEQDGMRIDFEKSWIHVRKSNTEPIVRLIAEAPTRKAVESLLDKAVKVLD